MWMQKAFTFIQVRINGGRREGCGVGGWGWGGERVTRAYTVEVQTASVFYAQSLILLLFEP